MKSKVKLSKSETDWKRLRSMKDSDIDFSDIPELTPEMLRRAVVRVGTGTLKTTARGTAVGGLRTKRR
jgi:hypothetical protein